MKNKNQKQFSLVIKSIAVIVAALFIIPNFTQAEPSWSFELTELTNQSRQENGLSQLRTNDVLTQIAQTKANDMIANNYFAHTSPSGVTPWAWFHQAHYEYIYAGENLAMDFNNYQDVHRAWLASPTHRENILSPDFDEIGIATASGMINGHQTIVVAQEFGRTNESRAFNSFNQDQPDVLINQGSGYVPFAIITINDNNQELTDGKL